MSEAAIASGNAPERVPQVIVDFDNCVLSTKERGLDVLLRFVSRQNEGVGSLPKEHVFGSWLQETNQLFVTKPHTHQLQCT